MWLYNYFVHPREAEIYKFYVILNIQWNPPLLILTLPVLLRELDWLHFSDL